MRRFASRLLIAAALAVSGPLLPWGPMTGSVLAATPTAQPEAPSPRPEAPSAAPSEAKPEPTENAEKRDMPAPADPAWRIIGAADAPVTIIEYASMTCPHCAHFHNDVLPVLRSSYIDTGKVRLIFRDYPLDRLALAASMVARCAPEDKSLEVTSRLFETQPTWAGAEQPIAAIAEVVAPLGLDRAAVEACVQNEDVAKPVLEQAIYGQENFEIRSTPTFILNGEVMVGALSPEAFAQKIDAALK